jgi:oxygen-independent coproporphyrinogen-3 oxidase
VTERTVGVYLHVPFCERVCPYCDFAVVAARRLAPASEAAYVEALRAELALRRPAFAGLTLETLYLGGGTPSLLTPDSVGTLLAEVRRAFPPGAGPLEVTLEVNPSTLERERLPAFRDAGVNRLSIGVQSFDDTVLRRLGRAHRGEEARRTLRAAREAAFENLSLDLIVAAPGASAQSLERDLDQALDYAPEHVSAYALTVEEGTPFALAARRGQLALPDEDAAAEWLERVAERLEAGGLERYEISNFARPGRASRHNRRYWERRPVLGLGVSAWSSEPPSADFPHGARVGNLRELPAYLERVGAGRTAEAAPPEALGPAVQRGEVMFLALRTRRGLQAAAFAAEFGAPPRAFFAAPIERLRAAGLLEETEQGDLRLTRRGVLLSDSVFAEFF